MLHWYTYLFPLACILLIAMAYAGLPALKQVSLALPGEKEKTLGRKDLVILLVITLLYGCVAFIGLGGHTDPESGSLTVEERRNLPLALVGLIFLHFYPCYCVDTICPNIV